MKWILQRVLYCSNTRARVVCADEVVSWRTFGCVRQKYVRIAAHWTAVVCAEWAGGGRRSHISFCRLRRLQQLTEAQAEGLSENNTDSFVRNTAATNESQTKILLNFLLFLFCFFHFSFLIVSFFLSFFWFVFSRRFLRSAKRVEKTSQRWVLRGSTCSWRIHSLDKGTKTDKTRLPMIFSKRRSQRWSD